MNVTINSGSFPRAYICINKNRVKLYNNRSNLYMKDKAEFQIELDNPTSSRYLANITVNGTSIGPGIILKPGEHIFLDRFTESNNKFKFSTYEIKSNREHLTEDNGVVEISFHSVDHGWTTWTAPLTFNDDSSGTTYIYTTDNTNDNIPTIGSINVNYNTSNIETGSVEKGSKSEQKLEEGSGNFSVWASETFKYKILPESAKHLTTKDLRNYCTECGRRSKKGWKFCPSCGKKV